MRKAILISILALAVVVLLFFVFSQTSITKSSPFAKTQGSSNSAQNTQESNPTPTPSSSSSTTSQSSSSSSSGGGGGGGGSSGGSGQTSNGPGSNETIKAPNYCTPESRDVESCDDTQHFVCGWYNPSVTCTVGPCVRMYGNECLACKDPTIDFWTEGECPIHG